MLIACLQEKMIGTQCRESAEVPVPGGDTPDAAARQLWYCIGTITTRILAADLLQELQAQSINSRSGCSVKAIGSADPVEEAEVGFENRRRLRISAETRSQWLITRCKTASRSGSYRTPAAR
jgi:hypothetical protein